MDLNHIHLRVKDITAAKNFYKEYFNFKENIFHGSILFLRNENGFDLALAPSETIERFPEWFHFGFRLNTADEVKELYLKMKSGNVNIVNEIEEENDFIFFRCSDPDGHLIEVYRE